MKALSAWFESIGVSPTLGGVLLGLALGFLFFRKRGARPTGSVAPSRGSEARGTRRSPDDAETKRLALEAILRGNKIEAIKIVRDHEKTDLLTAKERVDEWAREVE